MIPKNPETGKATAKLALREQSPIVVAHLTKGCTTCAAGLEMFQRTDTPDTVRRAVMELFERELFSTLQASGNRRPRAPSGAGRCGYRPARTRRRLIPAGTAHAELSGSARACLASRRFLTNPADFPGSRQIFPASARHLRQAIDFSGIRQLFGASGRQGKHPADFSSSRSNFPAKTALLSVPGRSGGSCGRFLRAPRRGSLPQARGRVKTVFSSCGEPVESNPRAGGVPSSPGSRSRGSHGGARRGGALGLAGGVPSARSLRRATA